MLIEACLQFPRESLQIPVPESYRGERTDSEDPNIHISSQPTYYTSGELDLVAAYLVRLPYAQAISKTGAVLVGRDPLLTASSAQIDAIEKQFGLGSSKALDDGSERPVLDRALALRENGYTGSVLAPVAPVTAKVAAAAAPPATLAATASVKAPAPTA